MRIVPTLALALALASCTSVSHTTRPDFGAQLFTVRADMERDTLASLKKVAELGYDEVEFSGTFGFAPATLCEETRRLGLDVASTHADWRQLRDDPMAALAQARALCTNSLILAWIPPEQRTSAAQWREWIGYINRATELAQAQGMQFGYHAHAFEFEEIDGLRPIDLLVNDTNPALRFELDTYWVARAGLDPLQFLRDHADRVTHLHLKDMAPDGSMADIGEGILDIEAIIEQAQAQGVSHFLVERDDAPQPWESLAASLDSLDTMALQREAHSIPSGASRK